MAAREDTNPNAPAKGKTGNEPARQREGGVKEEGQGETDPENSTPNTDEGTE